MSKYNGLKEQPDDLIIGVKWSEEVSEFQYKDRVTIVRGLPACPECGHTLGKDFVKGSWLCSECHTVYDTDSLVRAIKSESALFGTPVSLRGLEG